jgi:hypothetical protein
MTLSWLHRALLPDPRFKTSRGASVDSRDQARRVRPPSGCVAAPLFPASQLGSISPASCRRMMRAWGTTYAPHLTADAVGCGACPGAVGLTPSIGYSDRRLAMYDVNKLSSLAECRTVMQRARERNVPEVYKAAFQRPSGQGFLRNTCRLRTTPHRKEWPDHRSVSHSSKD